MDKLVDYLKSLNPKKNEQSILIYGSEYKLYRDNKYIGIGIGTWVEDTNVGDSFQSQHINAEGELVNNVFVADTWELIIKK